MLPPQAPHTVAADVHALHPLEAIRILRSAGRALFAQATLHAQLASVEWTQEKRRLGRMLIVTLLGFACVLCFLLAAGVLALACAWETPARMPVAFFVLALYALGIALAWRRLQELSALGEESFAASREELAADMATLKRRL